MWVPPEEKDPVVLHAPTRKSVGYFGAVRLRDGKFVYQREDHRFNAESYWSFLKILRQRSARSGREAVIISDNARYHHGVLHKAWRQKAEPNFRLHFLPPYSPDLNPVERVWKLTRRLCIHNEYFANVDDVALRVESQFTKWENPNKMLKQLCSILK